jgi:2-oxoglutarate dehydrogenase E1 component
VTHLIFCSGKIHVELVTSDKFANVSGAATARIEELYPWPVERIEATLKRFPNLREVIWLQEEPSNMGAWSYISPKLREAIDPRITLNYVGRAESASTGEGSTSRFRAEQARILHEAIAKIPSIEAGRSTLSHAV